jgi:hypothetical protein
MQPRRIAMAQNRPGDREDGREQVTLPSQSPVADGVNAAVELNELPIRQPTRNTPARHARLGELPPGYQPPLRSRQLPDHPMCGQFCTTIGHF